MKKIIRLTESDLTNIVKRVIKENSMRDDLIQMIKDDGWEKTAKLVGGDENLIELLGMTSPMDYLHLFDDLNISKNEEEPNWILFNNNMGNNLMVYNKKSAVVYIDITEIWSILKKVFGLTSPEIQTLTEEWLKKVYNLKKISTTIKVPSNFDWLVG